jgi:hypothetical protein
MWAIASRFVQPAGPAAGGRQGADVGAGGGRQGADVGAGGGAIGLGDHLVNLIEVRGLEIFEEHRAGGGPREVEGLGVGVPLPDLIVDHIIRESKFLHPAARNSP